MPIGICWRIPRIACFPTLLHVMLIWPFREMRAVVKRLQRFVASETRERWFVVQASFWWWLSAPRSGSRDFAGHFGRRIWAHDFRAIGRNSARRLFLGGVQSAARQDSCGDLLDTGIDAATAVGLGGTWRGVSDRRCQGLGAWL